MASITTYFKSQIDALLGAKSDKPIVDTAANLAAANPVPAVGRRVRESDTGKWKTGDGTTHYNDLPYDPDAPCWSDHCDQLGHVGVDHNPGIYHGFRGAVRHCAIHVRWAAPIRRGTRSDCHRCPVSTSGADGMMHTLYYRDQPIAAAERWQRCCMEMAKHPARVQKHMRITSGRPHSFVEVLT